MPPRGVPWAKETPRRTAKALGLTRYFTGEPCKNGHIAERRVANGLCIECAVDKQKRLFLKNPAPYLAKWAMAGKNWAAKNPEYFKEWKRKNGDKVRAHNSNRRAVKRLAIGTHTPADVAEILLMQGRKCACCRVSIKKKYHIDHIIPLSMGGRNDRRNLQILCAPCNLSKHALDPIDFMRSRGKLL